jgi:hypothetical protein
MTVQKQQKLAESIEHRYGQVFVCRHGAQS